MKGDETLPLRPDSVAPYSATKAQAEQLVRDASDDGFDAVVLRPRFVWGVGDTTLLPAIAEAARGRQVRMDLRAATTAPRRPTS